MDLSMYALYLEASRKIVREELYGEGCRRRRSFLSAVAAVLVGLRPM